ncbi:hypothetical protein [Streptomyces sp. NRRL WC-3742]|uniref:hypothetical protein n=1 Tax=Streptomyces sp. NRRL WC-3742 TaxID=1463934 RepID=UPI0004C6F783|nr:hypothetical protein [Streptomyces sp. NRRL WC-3742]
MTRSTAARSTDVRSTDVRSPALPTTRPTGRPAALPTVLRRSAGVVVLLALASGCGIRPTAVPVDAGAPASRTACPTTPHVPTALATPAPTPAVTPARGGAAKGAASPSPAPAQASAPPDNPFSAVPSAGCR